jgi:hypothetical protein
MKLIRPYIPLNVRCEVAARQLLEQGSPGLKHLLMIDVIQHRRADARLKFLLHHLFGDQHIHLDHDPALCLREIIDADNGIYKPDANDPRYLVYRTKEDHRVKTFIRGEAAQLSDAGKRRKEIWRKRKKMPSRWPPHGSRPLQWRAR